ncbi:MAG: hypothetical protein QOF25_3930, partial [Mycobacterium sp.]|nr:hypothetical protein [Mycobacterium sp.]
MPRTLGRLRAAVERTTARCTPALTDAETFLLTVTEDADDGVTVMRRGLGRIRVRGRRGDGV